jgi:hypothetical protein
MEQKNTYLFQCMKKEESSAGLFLDLGYNEREVLANVTNSKITKSKGCGKLDFFRLSPEKSKDFFVDGSQVAQVPIVVRMTTMFSNPPTCVRLVNTLHSMAYFAQCEETQVLNRVV